MPIFSFTFLFRTTGIPKSHFRSTLIFINISFITSIHKNHSFFQGCIMYRSLGCLWFVKTSLIFKTKMFNWTCLQHFALKFSLITKMLLLSTSIYLYLTVHKHLMIEYIVKCRKSVWCPLLNFSCSIIRDKFIIIDYSLSIAFATATLPTMIISTFSVRVKVFQFFATHFSVKMLDGNNDDGARRYLVYSGQPHIYIMAGIT